MVLLSVLGPKGLREIIPANDTKNNCFYGMCCHGMCYAGVLLDFAINSVQVWVQKHINFDSNRRVIKKEDLKRGSR